jgi:hypothetical protein
MDIVSDGPRLVLEGDFDVRNTSEVRAAIYRQLETHDQDIVVDLTEVACVDVTALRVVSSSHFAWLWAISPPYVAPHPPDAPSGDRTKVGDRLALPTPRARLPLKRPAHLRGDPAAIKASFLRRHQLTV